MWAYAALVLVFLFVLFVGFVLGRMNVTGRVYDARGRCRECAANPHAHQPFCIIGKYGL